MEITRLFDFLTHQLENNPLPDALVSKTSGAWVKTSTQEYQDQANQISRGLLRMGIKPGDHIALITTTNRTEWNIMDIGLQQIGVISVPVYPSISPEEYEYIFNQAKISFSFVSDKELYEKMMKTKPNTPDLVGVYTFDEVADAPNWKEILDMGEDDSNQGEVDAIKDSIKNDDVVTIIYTSGTTGKPKGVVLSHNNIVSNVLASKERVPDMGDNARAMSFLPICHVFERMLIYLYQYNAIPIYYAESIESIGDNLKELKPTVMTVVPRLVEKVYAKIYDTGSNAGGIKTKLFMWALDLVKDFTPYKEMPFMWKLKYKFASATVFKKWREGVGGNMVCMVSGSAKLSPRLNRLFWAAGIPIIEGYGLTETSPVISVNSMDPKGFAIGSVGSALDKVDIRIAEDGEIQVKGPNVFQEYYQQPEKTAEVFTEDGYFMTGDIGEIKDGLLFITDRKKQIFKTSGGKYVAPQIIENAMKAIPFIEQIMVVGEGQKMPCAIIQPNFDYVREFIKRNDLPFDNPSNEEIANAPSLKSLIEEQIKVVNRQFGKWEQVKKFELTPDVWTIEDGLLTPTLKHKRKNIQEKYQDLYDKMYDETY
ncbi:long-chain fatty acid--CoA ligase [Weeksellaceae bacterium KMM 9713]|uniref:Long-chain fatty acid--CoA ligase n=1 Tax=Profundicola chukchiensis TaxID=2961959 RepID=A0A9X4MXX4_9FLAO|nr:long-chain fatty acid--CoA ligase [Profundicola chukchiensis]MDG4946024.1 long-chain fatty acid--CoA ligase [Profundicola chukchiensis]MDG4949618.1 long-chain fatty acid--CoA ligase [Profundicola chukchiensis]